MKAPFHLVTAALLASNAHAASYVWVNVSPTGAWGTGSNWDRNSVPGTTDKVTIGNGGTVTRTSDLSINDNNSSSGIPDGLHITHGTLNITGNYTSYTSGGPNSALVNNIGVSDGTTAGNLEISGTFHLGNTSSTSTSSSSFNIYSGSSITADSFQGRHGAGAEGSNDNITGSGWVINVLGGSFNITTAFEFSQLITNGGDQDPNGRLSIGSTGTATGGTVSIGTMSQDWDDRPGQYVLFNDTLGSLTFGKTNYSDLASVQALITSQHLRKDAAITEDFNIADNGTSWTVSFVPEPSALLLGTLGLLPLLRRKR